MSTVGPTRLILLQSGKYDYGEIELIRPLHLIGPNNVGKTSLISTLQFLYIDDQRYMHFSRQLDETRRYYFPNRHSYILFECLTPTGYRVVGVQGLGPLKRYEFQRFAYRGRFELDDFIENRTLRPEEEIKARLSNRDYTLLEPRHLQAALTGIGDNKGVHLGLVPIRNRDHYERFRRAFSNLLRLSHLSQDEMKRFLFEIYSGEFKQREIDLEQGGYSSQYQKVRKGADELRDLQTIADAARQLVLLAEKRNGLRLKLPVLWSAIREGFLKRESEASERRTELESEASRIRSEDDEIQSRRTTLEVRSHALAESIGALNHQLKELTEAEIEFREYMPEFADARFVQLKKEIQEAGIKLRDSTLEPREKVQNRIKSHDHELQDKEVLRAQVSRTLALRLKKLFPDSDLKQIFRILNPNILGLLIGLDEVEIVDESFLRNQLQYVLSKISEETYHDKAIRIKLDRLEAPDLEEFLDVARISGRIEEIKVQLQRDTAILQAINDAEIVKRKIDELERESESLQERRLRYNDYLKANDASKEWRGEREKLLGEESNYAKELKNLEKQHEEIVERLRTIVSIVEQLKKDVDRLKSRIRLLEPPHPEWTGEERLDIPTDMEDLFSLYDRLKTEERESSSKIQEGLKWIESRTYGRYRAGAEEETLKTLSEELDALSEREEAVQKLWTGLGADLRGAFKGLSDDLDTLKSRVDELNRQLAKVSVSNLAKLHLHVRDIPQWIERIRTVIDAEELPLFGNPQATENALKQLGDLLQSYRRVELFDLFELSFEVTTADGKTNSYPKLESIESHGTTITIKVLINLMLLRGLLDDRKGRESSIPFYLDEASSLDSDNLKAIVEQAQSMGFTPILASPEPMDAADHLYFLVDRNGRVLLEPRASMRIRRDASPDSETENSGEKREEVV